MRILLAPDSSQGGCFGWLTAQAMARGIKRGNPQAECWLMPSSGWRRRIDARLGSCHRRHVACDVETVDAAGRPIIAQFGLLGNKHISCTAVVELASASGS